MNPKDLIIQTKSQCSLLRLLINHLCEDIERFPESPCSKSALATLESTFQMLKTINNSLTHQTPPNPENPQNP